MKYLLIVSLVLCVSLCGQPKATSTALITAEHQIRNIWVFDTDQDNVPDVLMLELWLRGEFDKTIVFDKMGFYTGQIRQIDGQWIFIDPNGKQKPIKEKDTPQTLFKQT